jgi:hypothetical protein
LENGRILDHTTKFSGGLGGFPPLKCASVNQAVAVSRY